MLRNPRLVRLALWIGLASVILAALGWGVFQPWAANHFGYALPGQDHLPHDIFYAGRDYENPNECAGDNWCQPADKLCTSREQLIQQNLWPLKQVGSIPTPLGSSYPILAPPNGGKTQMFLLVLDNDDCYLTYSLSGGP